LRVVRQGGVRRVRIGGPGAAAPRLRSLLQTLGIEVVEAALDEPDVEIVVGGDASAPIPSDVPQLRLAASTAGATERRLDGGRIASAGVLADAVPSPGVTLVSMGRWSSLDAAALGSWRTVDGAVAAASERLVVCTLDPEAEASTWHHDPSFPVFVASALEHLVGGADRIEMVDGLPRHELLREQPVPPPAEVAAVRSLVRPAHEDPTTWSPATALVLLAAGLMAGAAVRGAGRFSGA
jgi:hypothetical protein